MPKSRYHFNSMFRREREGGYTVLVPANCFKISSPSFCASPENLLVFDKHPVEFERLVGRRMLTQNHVAHVHRVRQGRIFG